MKQIKPISIWATMVCICLSAENLQAQVESSKVDSVKISVTEKDAENRNVMLNASSNTGPRNVNIGLPASVGGTTILENGLPVVYFFWPEFPIKAWRQDASLSRFGLLKLGEAAISIGDVGFAVNSYTNMGTDELQVNGSVASNSFGLMRGMANASGHMGKGWYFTASGYANFDPGTFDIGFTKYFDAMQLYKAGINKKYNNGKGEIGVLYKYANTKGFLTSFSPFIYNGDGSVTELSNFRIGRDSYYERSGKVAIVDPLTGEKKIDDVYDDHGTQSHTVDLIGKNLLGNGMKVDYTVRYHNAKVSTYLPAAIGVANTIDPTKSRYTYLDDGSTYSGPVQTLLALGSRQTPIQSLTGLAQLSGKSENGKHSWRVGLNEWFYNVNKFNTSSSIYYHEVAAQPRRLAMQTSADGGTTWTNATDDNGIAAYNTAMEYHNGNENKLAVFASDDWKISEIFSLGLGARLEWQRLNGDYYPYTRVNNGYVSQPTVAMEHNWFNKAFYANAVYKATRNFGLLGEVVYNEQAGHLENYSGATDPNLKKSQIPSGSFGVFFNHPMISIVSQVTYIQRNNYRTRLNLSDPAGTGAFERPTVSYDIKTFGWTTDVVTTPFKNFNLHFLLTIQQPKYENYNFQAFGKDYSYDGKIVQGVPQTLIEIDPSYTFFKSLRVWASARYFSKQYANQPNTLYFNGRWETFAGVNYKMNKHLDFGVTVVNLLNQRGAQGTISGAELVTDASPFANKIVTGTYIRPFTVEFGVKFKL